MKMIYWLLEWHIDQFKSCKSMYVMNVSCWWGMASVLTLSLLSLMATLAPCYTERNVSAKEDKVSLGRSGHSLNHSIYHGKNLFIRLDNGTFLPAACSMVLRRVEFFFSSLGTFRSFYQSLSQHGCWMGWNIVVLVVVLWGHLAFGMNFQILVLLYFSAWQTSK